MLFKKQNNQYITWVFKSREALRALRLCNIFPLTDRTVGSTQNYYLPNMAQRSDYTFPGITKLIEQVSQATRNLKKKKDFLKVTLNIFTAATLFQNSF